MHTDTTPANPVTATRVAKTMATSFVAGFVATLASAGVIAGHAGALTLRTTAFAIREARTTHYRSAKHELSTIATATEAAIQASAHGHSAWDAAREVLKDGVSDEEYSENLKKLRDFSF